MYIVSMETVVLGAIGIAWMAVFSLKFARYHTNISSFDDVASRAASATMISWVHLRY
jgi:hypothetical protein